MKLVNLTSMAAHAFSGLGPGEQPILTVIVKETFSFTADGLTVVATKQIPIAFADDISAIGETRCEFDLAPFKPRTDITLLGKAYIPQNGSAPSVDVTLRVGSVHKTLRVFGDRTWNAGGFFGGPKPNSPLPFAQMDLSYTKAYGGIDIINGGACQENPIGKGCIADKAKKKTVEGRLLPNIENAQALIKTPDDRPAPSCFGVVGKGWQPRVKHLGTFDEAWQQKRAPRLPEDYSFEFHNAAPRDQQIEGYLQGDESIELVNLTPEGRLLGRVPRVSIQVDVALHGSTNVDRLRMNLDTLCLMPDEKCMTATWRGIYSISDQLASQVDKIIVSI